MEDNFLSKFSITIKGKRFIVNDNKIKIIIDYEIAITEFVKNTDEDLAIPCSKKNK